MNICIVGYGKMGREIERLARERGHAITATLDVGDRITRESIRGAACAIEFSVPSAVVGNIEALAGIGCPVVVGTTGWYDRLDEVKAIIARGDAGLLYSPNFSIGMNFFFRIVREAARLFNKADGYDIAVHEIHHKMKIDSPSGTALRIARSILEEFTRKTELLTETSHGAIRPDQLHVTSSRVGTVAGRHDILIDSEFDAIELRHTIKQRSALASGAVLAAEWLGTKKGVYTFDDVLQTLIA